MFALLDEFARLFCGKPYHHRHSTQGDRIAQFLYEDLLHIQGSRKYTSRVIAGEAVLNSNNRTHGVHHRRGDGSFGTLIPGDSAIWDPGFEVARGPIATIEIGTEVKIVSKAMIRQIDRVENDLRGQVQHFQRSNPDAITVGIVGVNHAESYCSFEGTRSYPTTGRGKHLHPSQEAGKAIERLHVIRDLLDELVVLRFIAANVEPFTFHWVNEQEAHRNYGSALVRILSRYERRF